jgi:hypothetical protein
MTISAHRTRIIWSPLLGWALLSFGASAVNAQQAPAPSGSDPGTVNDPGTVSDPGTVTQTVPPGGAAPVIVAPGSPDDSFRRGEQRRTSATLPDLTLTAPAVPSAATTIVNSPVGSSVPYFGYGGLSGSTITVTGNTSGSAPSGAGGIALGAFTLVPQLELNVGVDSNVYAQSSSLGTTPTLYSAVTPTLDLRSEWLNHSLHVLASGTLGWYAAAPAQNFQNYGIAADGRIDIRTDWYVTGLVGYVRTTEALGSPNSTTATAPTVSDTIPFQIGMFQQVGRFFYQLTARATRFWYHDYSVVPATGLPAASRNRIEFAESIKIGYQLFEDLAVFVAPNLSQIRYDDPVNIDGQERNSNGLNFSVGATWQVNAVSILEGQIGRQTTSYPSGLGGTSDLSYSLVGTYTGYAPVTIRPAILRTINESALSQYSNFISTTYAVDITYLIHDAWTLTGGLLFQTADYTAIPGTGASPRTDYFFRGQIGLLYSLRPEIQIGPVFEYAKGSSTNSLGPSYDRQVFSIRLIAKR